jgi:hypothetical protein
MASPGTSSLSLEEILQTLTRLEDTLKSLPDKQSAPKLSHYRVIPSSLQNALDLLLQAASSIHAGSTKFALMGKIDISQATEMARDTLLPGCQWLCTGALVVHQDSTGCVKCLRHSLKQATRAILHTTIQLIQCFTDPAKLVENENLAAQRTGAVWEACQAVMDMNRPHATLAVSNQLAMRRVYTTYIKECTQTMEEFQEMIDAGPISEQGDNIQRPSGEEESDAWEDFLGGGTDQYSSTELPAVTAALALVKCSRGCNNVAMQACESIGKTLEDETNASDGLLDQAKLQWISRLYDCAEVVGEGMTDLGAAMYPPIKWHELESHVRRQSSAMEDLLTCIFDNVSDESVGRDVANLASKLQTAVTKRTQEAVEALALGTPTELR